MKALVTGAGGFVGANLVRRLRNRGDEPVAVIRPGPTSWRLREAAPEARVEMVDLRRPQDVARVVADAAPDVIFNLGAYGAYSWQTDLDEMLAVNVRATEALLESARAVDARVIQAGSSSEYGFCDRAPTEGDLIRPNSHYAITKAAATHLCQLAAARYGQYAVTLRLYSVYGPWEEPGRLMPTLVARALAGTYPPLVSPETARDFVWIEDVCDAFIRAASVELQEPGVVLNVASATQTTLRSLVATAREVFDLPVEPEWGTMPQRDWDTAVWVGDPAQAAESIGWRAVTPLSDGLIRLAAWMRDDPQRWMRYSARVPAAA
jgi:nucleoside-diphosphate-sugar epimerase